MRYSHKAIRDLFVVQVQRVFDGVLRGLFEEQFA